MGEGTHKEKPVVLALIICENVIVNQSSKNHSYIEAHNCRLAKSVPAQCDAFFFVAVLTNVVSTSKGKLTLTSPSGSLIFEIQGTIEASSPLIEVPLNFRLGPLLLHEFGMYRFDVYSGNEHLGGRGFNLIKIN